MNKQPSGNNFLLIHPDDNVLVQLGQGGETEFGHKVARHDIAIGEKVIKYGSSIGTASRRINRGEPVHSHNLTSALKPDDSFTYNPRYPMAGEAVPLEKHFFAGYRRSDGKIGIRNEIWIIPAVGCVNRTAEKLAQYGREQIIRDNIDSVDTVQAWIHPYGCSQLGDDHVNTRKTLAALAAHPNAAGVLLLGLGCENNQMDQLLAENVLRQRPNLQTLIAQETSDELAAGKKMVDRLLSEAAGARREKCPASDLVVGLKCGGSDALSGLTANPLLGRFSEWLVAQGGSVLLTEIPEFFGAEQQLLDRSENLEVYSKFSALLRSFREDFARNNLPVYENPSPGNKQGGITTLEEKSLGCVQKAGQVRVADILAYGEQIKKKGLSIVEGPGNDIIACTALAAAGAQLLLFTTGRGTPLGGPVPTVKIASNPDLAKRKPHWIDLTASPPQAESRSEADSGELIRLVLDLAGGRYHSRNEMYDYREISIFKKGVTL